MANDMGFIKQYSEIYSFEKNESFFIPLFDSVVLMNENGCSITVDNVEVSNYYLNLTHHNLQDERVSDALFFIYTIVSCLDFNKANRVLSKTKFILLLNVIYSDLNNKGDLLKKIFSIHSGSQELMEQSQFLIEDTVYYVRGNAKLNVLQVNKRCLLNDNGIVEGTSNKINRFIDDLFYIVFSSKKNTLLSNDLSRISGMGNDELLNEVMLNNISIDSIFNDFKLTIKLLSYSLRYYRIGSWEDGVNHVSMFYGSKINEKLEGVIKANDKGIKFPCEYFIESLTLRLHSKNALKVAMEIISSLSSREEKIKFKLILFKVGLSSLEIKEYLKNDMMDILTMK